MSHPLSSFLAMLINYLSHRAQINFASETVLHHHYTWYWSFSSRGAHGGAQYPYHPVSFTCTTAFPVIATPFVSVICGYFAIVLLYNLPILNPRPLRGRRIVSFNSVLFPRNYSCRRIEEPSPPLCPVVLSCALFLKILIGQ